MNAPSDSAGDQIGEWRAIREHLEDLSAQTWVRAPLGDEALALGQGAVGGFSK